MPEKRALHLRFIMPNLRFLKPECAAWGLAFFILFSPSADAEGLLMLWSRADSSDPSYLASLAQSSSARQRMLQTRAGLLPQVQGSYTFQRNDRTSTSADTTTFNPFAPPPGAPESYNSAVSQLHLSQSVVDLAKMYAYEQGKASFSQASISSSQAHVDLANKFLEVWLDALQARDRSLMADAQVAWAREELRAAREGEAQGRTALPQIEAAAAKAAQHEAESIIALDESKLKLAELEAFTGPLPTIDLPVLIDDTYEKLAPPPLARLQADAERLSPAVRAAAEGARAARIDVRKQRAGHLPTVELVGNWTHNKQGAGNTIGDNRYFANQNYLGLQANVPIFKGGEQHAKVMEAKSNSMKAELEQTAAVRQIRQEVNRAWLELAIAQRKNAAAKMAVQSSETTLRAVTAGESLGLRSSVDVAKARAELAVANTDLRSSRYDSIACLMRIRLATGFPVEHEMTRIDRQFAIKRNP